MEIHTREAKEITGERPMRGVRIGRLEINIWKDTGKPKFRIVWGKGIPVYSWYFKIMSYYTLWISWRKHND